MEKLTKSKRKKLQRKAKVTDVIEQRLLNYFKKSIKLKITKDTTLDELENQLRKIDYAKLNKFIKKTGLDILQHNRDSYKNIMEALVRGTKTKIDQKSIDLAMGNLTQDKKIMQPLLDRFEMNVGLIKNVPQEVVNDLRQAYSEGVGLRGTDIEKQLWEKLGKRAKLIIRTESSKINTALTEVRSKLLNIPAYVWCTSEDQRVRPSHKVMDGVLVFWGTRLELDGMTGHAGEFPNCIPGDTPVSLDFGVQKLFKHFYKGSVYIITLDNGTTITCTPNHPLFDGAKFRPANTFNIGEQLIEISTNSFSCTFPTSESNCDAFKPTIKQIFDTFSLIGASKTIRGIGGEFHGDVIVNDNIDIIDVHTLLIRNIVTPLLQKCKEFLFPQTGFTQPARLFPIECPMFSFSDGVMVPTKCRMCRKCVFNVLLSRTFRHHKPIRFSLCSALNIILSQYSINDTSSTIKFFSQLYNTRTAIVIFDYLIRRECMRDIIRSNTITGGMPSATNCSKSVSNTICGESELSSDVLYSDAVVKKPHSILQIRVSEFSNHVYNLQSDYGYYTTNGNILQHNCRCLPLPITNLDDLQFPIKVAEGNLTIKSKYIKGSHGKKYDVDIINGRIVKYTKAEFMQIYGKLFR